MSTDPEAPGSSMRAPRAGSHPDAPPAASLPGAGGVAARGGALRSAGFAVSALLSLATIPLMVRHLGVTEFGQWVTVLALVNLVGLAGEMGLTAIAVREYPLRAPAERERLLRAVLGLRIVLALAGTVLAVSIAWAVGWSGAMVAGAALASVALWFGALQELQVARLSGELRFAAVTAVELARAGVVAAAVVVLVVAGAGLVPFYAVYGAGALAAVVVAASALRGTPRLLPSFAAREWGPLWREVAVYAAATAAYVVYFRVVILVASATASEEQVGLFATGFRVIEFVVAIPGVLLVTVLPVLAHAAQHDRARLERAVTEVVRAGLVVGAGAALGLGIGAPVVMDVIGGDAADAAVEVLRIQAITVATSFVAFGTGAALLALRRHRELLLVNLAALAVAGVLAAVLADSDGARGAAWAAVAGEAVLVIGQGVALARAMARGTANGHGRQPAAAADSDRAAGFPRIAISALTVAGAAGLAILAAVLLDLPTLPLTLIALAIYTAFVAATGQIPRHIRALARY